MPSTGTHSTHMTACGLNRDTQNRHMTACGLNRDRQHTHDSLWLEQGQPTHTLHIQRVLVCTAPTEEEDPEKGEEEEDGEEEEREEEED